MLHTHVFGRLWQLWGPFAADMYAQQRSAQCWPGAGTRLPFWALWVEREAAGIDALSADWHAQGGLCYAFPPVPMVGPTLEFLRAQHARAVVVVPIWPAQWWWPLLLSLRMEEMQLGQGRQVMGPVCAGAPWHPLGSSYASPESVRWMAALVQG
jgi:hypothetical protein